MLLKARTAPGPGWMGGRFSTLYRVDAIEGAGECGGAVVVGGGFSTLYRVDAIEG